MDSTAKLLQLNLDLCKRFNIQRSFTSLCHLQTNGLAESTNKSIKTGLAKCVGEHLNTWDECLPPVLFSLRSKPDMSTKMSPMQLMLGCEVRFPDQVPDNFTVQCDFCKRWEHIPCPPEGINEENLHDELKCNKCA